MGRHRINLIVKDQELDRIISRFLKQRIPAAKRSVFECFLSQFLEDLWKKLGDDFVSLVLRKAYEEPLRLSSDSSLMEKALVDIQSKGKKGEFRENEIRAPDMVPEESAGQEKTSDEEDEISLDDFLL